MMATWVFIVVSSQYQAGHAGRPDPIIYRTTRMRNGYLQLKFAHFMDFRPSPMPTSKAVPQLPDSIPVFKLYGEHQPWPTPDMMHCETIAARSTLHNWEIRPHQHHGLFQLLYLKAGQARIRADDDELDMQAGQVLLVPQMCIHGFNFAPHAEGHVLTLAYPLLARVGGNASELLLRLRRPYLHTLPPGEEGDGLRMHFSIIDREYRQAASHRELLLESLLAGMLAWLARQIVPPAPQPLQPGAARGPRHFGRFCQLIEAEYSTPSMRFPGMPAALASPRAPECLVRQASRQSALELIHERLLLEARRSLAYSARSVECGVRMRLDLPTRPTSPASSSSGSRTAIAQGFPNPRTGHIQCIGRRRVSCAGAALWSHRSEGCLFPIESSAVSVVTVFQSPDDRRAASPITGRTPASDCVARRC